MNSAPVDISTFVHGSPYVKKKTHGRVEGPKEWNAAIISQTLNLGRISEPCELEVDFVLWPGSSPTDHPHGPDLDNLLKNLMDALKKTILKNAPSDDGAIVRIVATKRTRQGNEPTGARIVVRPLRHETEAKSDVSSETKA